MMSSEGETRTSANGVADEEERELVIPGENKRLDTRDDVADTVKSIEDFEGLTALRLSGNSLGVKAAQAIADILRQKPTLRRALWSDLFVSRLKTEIPPAVMCLGDALIESQAQLTELDLSDNAFGPTGMEAVIALLTSPVCFSLKVLKFNNTGMGIGGGKILSRALLDCREEAEKVGQRLALEEFVVGRSRLEDDGATALAEVFKMLGSLVRVSMPQNGIRQDGIRALASAFSSNHNLQLIDLNDNTFTEEGSAAMAEVLPSLQQLRVINFGDCLVKSEGARVIAQAIKDGHRSLQEVNLSFNELDHSAALAVADALANKEQLEKIDLNGNQFGEEGIDDLKESLEAKGLLDFLGSLSDDEGVDSEEEEEEDSSRREESVSEEPEASQKEEVSDEASPSQELRTITVGEYLAHPTGDNLLALGEKRSECIRELAGETPDCRVVAELYGKVASCYTASCPAPVQAAVEHTLDVLLEPLFRAGLANQLLNEILVELGLLKSEDKQFNPVTQLEGPLLAVSHFARQQYFPRASAEILAMFLSKPSPRFQSLTDARSRVLMTLCTL